MRFVKDENENDYAHAGIVALEIQAGCSSPTQESGCYYRSIDMLVGDKQSVSVAPPELELSSQGGDPGDPCVDAGEPTFSAVGAAATFVRDYWIRVSAISAILLVPCFWHRRIEAGDLASHVYDAWLAQLIEQGQAPGLWLAQQWNNIFFNVLLVRLGNLTGLEFAEKICVSLLVLIFWGGAFSLVGAITRRIPWFLVPCLMIFAYGWTFHMGFLNYYISLGSAFFGMAMTEASSGWDLAVLLALVPLTWMAHPLGVVLLIGGSTYLALAKQFARRRLWFLLGTAGISLGLISYYISSHYEVIWMDGALANFPHKFSGVDQLDLFGTRYTLLSNLLLVFILACLVSDIILRLKAQESLTSFRVPLQIYVIAMLSTILFPDVIFFSQYHLPFSLLTERLTSITAILGCCLLDAMAPKNGTLWVFPLLPLFSFFSYTWTLEK
jgi:hypothetical protein